MPKDTIPENIKASENLFPVVGVGASAGGLEAFKILLQAIPADSGMAYIFVQHLAPHYESMLKEILQKSTMLPVEEIVDHVKVKPNHVYVIPSNKILVANGDVLQLFPRTEGEQSHAIDVFFTSLAEIHQDQAIGVLLSGTGSDGTVGLKTIKDVRGITIVQDAQTAAYYGMPRSAINADVVDFILPPSEIPNRLREILQNSPGGSTQEIQEDPNEEEAFKQILLIVKAKRGIDFKYYKQSTIRRRILRRKAINRLGTLLEYQLYLLESKSEQDALYKDILIPVTAFFRDPKVFSILYESLFPALLKEKPEQTPIRIWVAGCSTGEEAYSLAICLTEYFSERLTTMPVQIFATDIAESVITKARSGIYDKRDVAGVSESRLKQFFTKINGGYHINKQIREMCVFAHQNFLTDPPFAKMDIISCRNVLIYMEPYLQKKAMATFHYSLNPMGWLLLGKSESISQAPELFQSFHQPEKLFLRKSIPGKFMPVATERNEAALKRTDQELKNKNNKKDDYQAAADDTLLQLYTPVSVIVNEQMDIVQFRGTTSSYLEPPRGKASLNLLRMAKEGLAFELRTAIHKAKISNEIFRKEGIMIEKGKRKVDIDVIPLTQTIETYFIVVFKDAVEKPELTERSDKEIEKGESRILLQERSRIEQLEKELSQTREDMRSITEDQEAVNEELQSANEELLSSSEELQSLNEELETSKEEIQSTNEELTMLNQELIERNDQLVDARKYAEAIVTTIHEPLIILNKELVIKSANKSYYEKFSASPQQTEGKMFFELDNEQWNIDDLPAKLLKVITGQTYFDELEIVIDFQSTGKRILVLNARPLINENAKDPLILLAFHDITERKELERHKAADFLHTAKQRQLLLDFFHDAPAILAIFKGPEHICELANPQYIHLVGQDDPVGKSVHELFPVKSRDVFSGKLDHVFRSGETYSENELPVLNPTSGESSITFINLMVQPIRNANHQIEGLFLFAIDVTLQVAARKAIEENLRKVLESLYQISWTAEPDGVLNFFNRQFYQYTGLPKKRVFEKSWGAFVHPDQVDDLIRFWNEAISSGKEFNQQLLLLNADGSYRWHMVRASSVEDDTGSTVLWVATCTDIHDQKIFASALEQQVMERTRELLEANTDLNHSNENLEQFASIASHDLQEPLRKIKTFISVLNRKFLRQVPDDAKEYLGKIKASADRMSQLIHELLEYSKVMHTNKSFSRINLDQIIKDVLGDLDLLISETNAVIEYKAPGPVIDANALQMNQLFYNLLTNALKFYKEDVPPHICITFRNLSEEEVLLASLPGDRPYIEFCVSDNGIGFEQNFAEQIFLIFERLHAVDEFEGTGIGLALCKKVVENHHGLIFAKSRKNEGSEFHVILPVFQ